MSTQQPQPQTQPQQGGQPIIPKNAIPMTNPNASIYVGDLHKDVSEVFLFEVFKEAGSIISIRICRDVMTKESLGYAYINFSSMQEAQRAIDSLNYTVINDQPIRVMMSERNPQIRNSGIGNIFIKNLDASIDNKSLQETFSAFGKIRSCKVQHNKGSKSGGVGYVHFEKKEAADKAIKEVNGMCLNSRKVTVEHFKKKKKLVIDNTNFTNCYFKNFDKKITYDEIVKFFKKFGDVQNCALSKTKDGSSKGFGWCNYKKHESAAKAVEEMHDKQLPGVTVEGKSFFIQRAMRKNERQKFLRAKFQKEGVPKPIKQATNLYIKRLDESVSDKQLEELFAVYGKIQHCAIMKDEKGASKGFGFVNYFKSEDAAKAITEMNDKMVGSKPLYVALAQKKEERRKEIMQNMQTRMMQGTGFIDKNFYPMMRGGFQGMAQQGYGRGHYKGRGGYKFNGNARNAQRGMKRNQKGRGGYKKQYPRQGQQMIPQGMPQQQGFPQGEMMQQQQIMMPQLIAQGKINTQFLSGMNEEEQKKYLGELLFPRIKNFCAGREQDAGKITGMILEMDNSDLIALLESQGSELQAKVEEAKDYLKQASQEQVPEGEKKQ